VVTAAPIPAGGARRERDRRHPFLNYGGHIVVAVISAFVLIVTGVYWNIRTTGDQDLKDNSVDIGSGDNSMVTARPSTTDVNGNVVPATYEAENFLLVGSDTRSGANNIDGSEGDLDGVANTDSIMLLHISADRQHIYAVSMPRDMWAPNVECNSYDQTTNTYGGPAQSNDLEKQHINSFYGVGGPKCLVDAVENLTQLNISHYIQIDFSGFQAMVDALGGIIVNVCRPIIDETLGTVIPTAGEQGIGGATALSLARARKVQGDTESDLARIHRQQVLLSTILRKVKSAGVLLDPGMLGDFVTAFTQNTTTAGINFNSLMTLAESLGDLDPSKVTFFTLPTVADPEDTSDRGSMFIDEDTAAPLLDAIRNDQPLPGADATTAENTTPPTTGPVVATFSVDPAAVDLRVVNVAGVSGVAGQAATELNELGFDVSESDLLKSDETEAGITVHYSPGNEAAALTAAAAAPGSTLVAEDGLGSAVELHLGEGWESSTFTAVTVGAEIPATLLAQVPEGSAGQVASVTGSTDSSGSTTATEIQQVNAGDASCM